MNGKMIRDIAIALIFLATSPSILAQSAQPPNFEIPVRTDSGEKDLNKTILITQSGGPSSDGTIDDFHTEEKAYFALDISSETRTGKVVASAAGRVVKIDRENFYPYIIVDHGNGYYIKYQEFEIDKNLEVIDKKTGMPTEVKAGEVLGDLGFTDRKGGWHALHWQVEYSENKNVIPVTGASKKEPNSKLQGVTLEGVPIDQYKLKEEIGKKTTMLEAQSNYWSHPSSATSNNTPAISSALMQNQLTAITQGGSSHIGSAALFIGHHTSTPAVINPIFTASFKNQTAAEQGVYSNSQAYTSSDWIMQSGDPAVHKMVGNSFGPITASNGGEITSLNNANVVSTHMIKEFYLPPGTKTVTLTLNGNFVTNEYPVFVGSQYNDYGVVKLISPSGTTTQVTAFKEVLNSSNFQNVSGLPAPMIATGGQTGFKSSVATIPVAGGGKVIVDVQVHNVGDTAYPSAVLMNNIQLK